MPSGLCPSSAPGACSLQICTTTKPVRLETLLQRMSVSSTLCHARAVSSTACASLAPQFELVATSVQSVL